MMLFRFIALSIVTSKFLLAGASDIGLVKGIADNNQVTLAAEHENGRILPNVDPDMPLVRCKNILFYQLKQQWDYCRRSCNTRFVKNGEASSVSKPVCNAFCIQIRTEGVCEQCLVPPVEEPSPEPSPQPSPEPSSSANTDINPTSSPTPSPTAKPTPSPSADPTPSPSPQPTPSPSPLPTPSPGAKPTPSPSAKPTPLPNAKPTPSPSAKPTPSPSAKPTPSPSAQPTPFSSSPPSGRGPGDDGDSDTPTPFPSSPPSSPLPDCPDDGICTDKPVMMTMLYTGGDCEQSQNGQIDKFTCRDSNGGPPTEEGTESWLVVTKKGDHDKVYFRGSVAVGQTFELKNQDKPGDDFDSDLEVRIFTAGKLLQKVEFHTSCSTTLGCEDRFGAVEVIEWQNDEQGVIQCDLCERNFCPNEGICEDKPVLMGMLYTGGNCSQSLNAQGDKFSCNDSNGGPPTEEGIKSRIVVTKEGEYDEVYHDDLVAVGQEYKLEIEPGQSFDSDLEIRIYNENVFLQKVILHTSCSKPLECNNRFGASQVISWLNKDQGLVKCSDCGLFEAPSPEPSPQPSPQPSSACPDNGVCKDKPVLMGMLYTGGNCSQSLNAQGDKFSCNDSNGGPPTEEGTQSRIIVTKEGDYDKVYHDDLVAVGQEYELEIEPGKSFDSDLEIRIYSSNKLLQKVILHTSCSKPLECNNRFGASQVISWLNKDQGLVKCSDCGPSTDPPTGTCPDNGVCKKKPVLMRMQYTGGDCSQSLNSQGDKFSCNDSNGGPPSEEGMKSLIVVTKEGENTEVYHDELVTVGQDYELEKEPGEGFDSDIEIRIYSSDGGVLLQRVTLHTSCSQTLECNNIFGASRVISWLDKEQTAVDCSKCNNDPSDCPNGPVCTDRPNRMVMLYNGGDCDQSFENQGDKFGCQDISGSPPTTIGDKSRIVVTKEGSPNVVYYSGNVTVGEEFELANPDDKDKFDSDLAIAISSVDGSSLLQTINFHASCSQDLECNNKFGAAQVVEWESEDQGLVRCSDCVAARRRMLSLPKV